VLYRIVFWGKTTSTTHMIPYYRKDLMKAAWHLAVTNAMINYLPLRKDLYSNKVNYKLWRIFVKFAFYLT